MPNQIVPFQRKAAKNKNNIRETLDGLGLLSELNRNLKAIESIDKELEDSIRMFEKPVYNEQGEQVGTNYYKSTILDKETIAVFHTRQAGRKMQIETIMRMLNKVMPDLKAIELNDGNVQDAATKALRAFAAAASEE